MGTLPAAMRRWIVGFLLVVMSIQVSWASVAAYCRHQADVVTDHIGHHEHQHQAPVKADPGSPPSDDADAPDAALGSVDNDCGYCHLSCAQPIAPTFEPWLGQAAQQFVSSPPTLHSSSLRERLERPNWRSPVRSASQQEQRNT